MTFEDSNGYHLSPLSAADPLVYQITGAEAERIENTSKPTEALKDLFRE